MHGMCNVKLIAVRVLKDALCTCLAAAWGKLVKKETKIYIFESKKGLYWTECSSRISIPFTYLLKSNC